MLLRIFSLLVAMACPVGSAVADCWMYASTSYNIEARLLKSIAEVESGMRPSLINKNKNGTNDYGLMQINSSHLGRLERRGVTKSMLMEDPCVSILVAASILKEMVDKYGYGWEAVGAYNAGLSSKKHNLRMKYARKVWQIYSLPQIIHLEVPINQTHRSLIAMKSNADRAGEHF